jgi:SAM-dependent methyltransferase
VTDTASILAPAGYDANADFWVRIIREQHDRYRTELTDDAVLAAIGDCSDLAVLDAGCGEGYMARELAGRGASRVYGIDASARLIAAAREVPAPGVSFSEGDIADLPFARGSFDLIVANHLLNDLPDITEPVRELARVLRPGGKIVALMLHPCFYGYRAETTVLDGLPAVDEYFTPRAVEQTFEVGGLTSPAPAVSWLRPLETYTKVLTGSGLHIVALTEPHPSAQQVASSRWWRDNFPRPLFMLLTAEKVPGRRQLTAV